MLEAVGAGVLIARLPAGVPFRVIRFFHAANIAHMF
jgi:hypothetical protein